MATNALAFVRTLRLCKSSNVSRIVCASSRVRSMSTSGRQFSIYEPPYLNKGPQVENYDSVNVRLRAYDYAVLESYAKYAHRFLESCGLDCEAYPVPTRIGDIKLFAPNSTNIENECPIMVFERTIQVQDLPSTLAPIVLETLQLNLPEGIFLTAKLPDPVEEDFRYVPDTMLLELRQQVENVEKNIEDIKKR